MLFLRRRRKKLKLEKVLYINRINGSSPVNLCLGGLTVWCDFARIYHRGSAQNSVHAKISIVIATVITAAMKFLCLKVQPENNESKRNWKAKKKRQQMG